MEEVIEQVKEILLRAFPGAATELEQYPGVSKVGGYLIWDGFEGVEQLDRQLQLLRVFRDQLGSDYRSKVTTILTVTPAEVSVMREG